MGNDDAREITRLKLQLAQALLRAKCLWFTYEVPDEFLQNRTRPAYDSGYEAGWRGWPYSSAYSRPHFQSAYRHGYADATSQLYKAALRAERTKGEQGL